MQTLAGSDGAGRARTAIRHEEGTQAPIWAKPKWQPEPAATGDEVQWGNPLIRAHLVNVLDDPAGRLSFLDAKARALVKNFLHHRNTRTGEITPGCPRLAYELPFKQRSIRYALGRLDTGPSCQRDGQVVDGHGLIWRDHRWRPYGGQTSNSYGLTCKLLELAGLVRPHAPESCTQCLKERAAIAHRARLTARRGRPRRAVAATLPLPGMPLEPAAAASPITAPECAETSPITAPECAETSPITAPECAETSPITAPECAETSPITAPAAPDPDPDFEVFARIFSAERHAKYGNQRGGAVRAEKRAAIGSTVLELTAEACAWARGRGLELDRAAVREDLCTRLVRTWLTWTGTDDYLITRPDPHPMGLIAGDLARLGTEAMEAWKRAQPRPKRVEALPIETPAASAEEAWPELDTSEPEAGELAQVRAELRAAPPPPEWLAFMAKLAPAVEPVAAPPPAPVQDEMASLRAKQAEIQARALVMQESGEAPAEAPPPRVRTRLGLRSRPMSEGDADPVLEDGPKKVRLRRPSQARPHPRRTPAPVENVAPNADDGDGERGDGDP